MTEQPLSPSAAEVLADEVTDRYLDQLQSGVAPDRAALFAAHPELADLLEQRLAVVEMMHRTACGEDTEPRPSAREEALSVPSDRLGRYFLLSVLGQGASGTVYHAYDPKFDREVALKVLRPERTTDADSDRRFEREARIAAQLRHPHIVPLHETGTADGRRYLDMELVSGETLEARLARGPLPPRDAAELVRKLADALDYAHGQGIVHRDVKPSNILVNELGPQLTDFGLARRTEAEASLTEEGTLVGTVAYMSPEQAQGGAHTVDGRSDAYSLGVVLYRLLTGRLPYPLEGPLTGQLYQIAHTEAAPLRRVKPDVPRDLETICLKALAKDPAERFATAAAFAEELRRWLYDEPLRVRSPTSWEKARRWGRRNRVAARVAVAAGMLLAVVGTVAAFAQYKAILRAETLDEVKWRALLEQTRIRMQSLNQGRRDGAQEILRSVTEVRKSLPNGAVKTRLDFETRSLYAMSLGVPEVRINATALLGGKYQCWSVAIHPDGQSMVIGTMPHPIRWKRGEPAPPERKEDEFAAVPRLAYSPDAKYLAFAPPTGGIQLWDGNVTQVMAERKAPEVGTIVGISFSAHDKLLRACEVSGIVRSFTLPELRSAGRTKVPGSLGQLTAAAFSSDSTRLAVGNAAGKLMVLETVGKEWSVQAARTDVTALSWSPANDLLAVATKEGQVQIRESRDGEVRHRLQGFPHYTRSVQFTPDGQYISAGTSGTMIWVVATGENILKFNSPPWGFARDGKTFAAGTQGGVAFGELILPKTVWPLRSHRLPVNKLAWSLDSSRLMTLDSGYGIRVWDVGAPGIVYEFAGPPGSFFAENAAIALNEDGTQFAYASGGLTEARALLHDVKQDKTLAEWKNLPGGYEQLAYLGQGRFLSVREEHEPGKMTLQSWVRVLAASERTDPPRLLRKSEPSDIRRYLSSGLTPDGAFFWWTGPRLPKDDRRVEVYEVATGRRVRRVVRPEEAGDSGMVCLTVDGRDLLIGLREESHHYDASASALPRRLSLSLIGISPHRRWLAYERGPDAFRPVHVLGLRRWDRQEPWLEFGGNNLDVYDPILFSPDERYVAWGTKSGTVMLVDLPALEKEVGEFMKTVLPR